MKKFACVLELFIFPSLRALGAIAFASTEPLQVGQTILPTPAMQQALAHALRKSTIGSPLLWKMNWDTRTPVFVFTVRAALHRSIKAASSPSKDDHAALAIFGILPAQPDAISVNVFPH